jgi:hypothetical protein
VRLHCPGHWPFCCSACLPHTTSATPGNGDGHRSSSLSLSTPSHRHGRYKRSTAAKNSFKRQHPCPSTGRSTGSCPGYVIDHINPLECGGADAPFNMQRQTIGMARRRKRPSAIVGCEPDASGWAAWASTGPCTEPEPSSALEVLTIICASWPTLIASNL